METFKQVFEEKSGRNWEDSRAEFDFLEDEIIVSLIEVLNWSEAIAREWFDKEENGEFSVADFVEEVKAYVDLKPENFRLLFMVDEMGQYVGTNTSLLLNLQSIIEEFGSKCRGQVWIVATGQEALDEMIKLRRDEFSRILARFKLRLSLTSSSVGEVIEKRLLTKNSEGEKRLTEVYAHNGSVLRNLFTLKTGKEDLRGFKSSDEFVKDFPFVPYQFFVLKDVFDEIRKRGHTGSHQSSGER